MTLAVGRTKAQKPDIDPRDLLDMRAFSGGLMHSRPKYAKFDTDYIKAPSEYVFRVQKSRPNIDTVSCRSR